VVVGCLREAQFHIGSQVWCVQMACDTLVPHYPFRWKETIIYVDPCENLHMRKTKDNEGCYEHITRTHAHVFHVLRATCDLLTCRVLCLTSSLVLPFI
jgi:hypothetical protein